MFGLGAFTVLPGNRRILFSVRVNGRRRRQSEAAGPPQWRPDFSTLICRDSGAAWLCGLLDVQNWQVRLRAAEFPSRNRLAVTGLQRPGIEDLRVGREILRVARDDGEAVTLRGGHEQAVHHRQRLSGQFRARGDLRPDV